MAFAHGFGCDQTVWREVAPAFELVVLNATGRCPNLSTPAEVI